MTSDSYRVLIADDHPLYRSAMSNVLADVFPDAALVECENLTGALKLLEQGSIDLVLLDLNLPDADRTDGLSRLRSAAPATPIVVCSALDEPALVRECFQLGVAGYLPKSSGMEVTRHALQLVRGGGVYVPSQALAESSTGEGDDSTERPSSAAKVGDLTPRQRTVLSLLERGMSNKAIARELGIGEITVKAHVSAILRKLGVENRLQAIIAIRERNS